MKKFAKFGITKVGTGGEVVGVIQGFVSQKGLQIKEVNPSNGLSWTYGECYVSIVNREDLLINFLGVSREDLLINKHNEDTYVTLCCRFSGNLQENAKKVIEAGKLVELLGVYQVRESNGKKYISFSVRHIIEARKVSNKSGTETSQAEKPENIAVEVEDDIGDWAIMEDDIQF